MSSDTPEHDKLQKIQHLSQAIGEFLDWASEAQGWQLGEWMEDEEGPYQGTSRMFPIQESRTDQLALFFNIDTHALEDEKLAMLDEIRALNK